MDEDFLEMFSIQLARLHLSRSGSRPDQHRAEVHQRGTYGELMDTIDEIIRDISSGDPLPDSAERRRGRKR